MSLIGFAHSIFVFPNRIILFAQSIKKRITVLPLFVDIIPSAKFSYHTIA